LLRPPDDEPIGIETRSGNETILTYICIVNHVYFIVVLTSRTRTFCNTTQQDAKHKDSKLIFRSFQLRILVWIKCIVTEGFRVFRLSLWVKFQTSILIILASSQVLTNSPHLFNNPVINLDPTLLSPVL
jgi:hypothetical protein